MICTNLETPPAYDDSGINLADPYDKRGLKTEYISLLQAMALEQAVGRGEGIAVDLGCGYGRMSKRIAALGYSVVGVEPSVRVLRHAAAADPDLSWCAARMPEIPMRDRSVDLVLLLNVVRALHLLGIRDVCADAARIVATQGRLVVLDNIREGDTRYVEDQWFVDFFASQGLRLTRRIPIRSGRNIWIYLIRFGFIPKSWFRRLAERELQRMSKARRKPRWTYYNVIYLFERPK